MLAEGRGSKTFVKNINDGMGCIRWLANLRYPQRKWLVPQNFQGRNYTWKLTAFLLKEKLKKRNGFTCEYGIKNPYDCIDWASFLDNHIRWSWTNSSGEDGEWAKEYPVIAVIGGAETKNKAKPWFVVLTNFHGVNISTISDFRLPRWHHWMYSWEEIRVGSYDLKGARSSISLL